MYKRQDLIPGSLNVSFAIPICVEATIFIKKVQAEKERTKEVRRQIDDLKKRLSTEGETVESSEKLKELSAKLDKRHKKRDKASSSPQIKVEEPLSVGDTVTVDGSDSVGEIIAIEGKNATVAMGLFKSRVPLSKLKKTIRKATAATQTASFVSSSTSDNMRSRQLEFKQEIDVRGMRADEALQAVSYFIDDAVQFNIKQIRILHGTGYGILRQRIREYLNTVPDVKSYRDEHVQFGGAGITVVELS